MRGGFMVPNVLPGASFLWPCRAHRTMGGPFSGGALKSVPTLAYLLSQLNVRSRFEGATFMPIAKLLVHGGASNQKDPIQNNAKQSATKGTAESLSLQGKLAVDVVES